MKLELFMFDTCPFCNRVMRFISNTGRTDVTYHDIRKSPEARERLLAIGGKEQVPCLLIDGEPLYESLDIINWLNEHPGA